MTLIVEDGTGMPDANAYISVAFADSYFAERGVTEWAALTVEQKEANIINATDYIDVRFAKQFRGRRQHDGQALQFPRVNVPCAPASSVPPQVRKATAEYAIRAQGGPLAPDPRVDPSGMAVTQSKRKVGPIETETRFSGATIVGQYTGMLFRPYPFADALLACTLYASGSGVMRN